MGRTVSEDTKNEIAWDSNAITPGESYGAPINRSQDRVFPKGTPFMGLLASSLKYWVVQKMNTDSYWRTVCSIPFNQVQ